jgi:pantoate ligase/cytidylate kinase
MFSFITIAQLQSELSKIDKSQSVGFVPTMGALHLGHQSLIEKAIAENELVVVSIFVNPLQFGENEDLDQYPRTLEADRQFCEGLGVKILFTPSLEEMTVSNRETTLVIPPVSMTSVLCGKYRKGHFAGVATIVTKLLNIVQPTVAYFGEKDAQQLAIIRRLVQDLHLPVIIKSSPIVREKSGLAYSSRNQYLNPQQKQEATALYGSLSKAKQLFLSGETNGDKLVEVVQQELALTSSLKLQYAELVDPETLKPLTKITKSALLAIACYVGETRLIDNVILELKQPIIAIDGPAGAGKSTISRRVASKLGLLYLDTGAMYRAITWLAIQKNMDIQNQEAIASLAQTATLELWPAKDFQTPTGVKINHQDVTLAIRTPEVTAKVSQIASQLGVRQKLVQWQKQWGEKGGLVSEGRDMGTTVFPEAKLKIFLTASVEERARRRLLDLQNQGQQEVDFSLLKQEIQQRDYLDSTRAISPLKKADDAIEVNTDGLTIEQVTEKIVKLFQQVTK